MTYYDFVRRFCVTAQGAFGEQIVGSRNAEQLAAILRPHTLRRRQADVQADLPPLRWAEVVLSPEALPPMPPDVAELDAIVQAALAADRGGDLPAALAAALNTVDQMHVATLRRWTGLAKAAAVGEQICADLDAGMGQDVVFAVHRDVMSALQAKIGAHRAAVLDGRVSAKAKQAMIDAFQGGELAVLVCQITVASTALTLTATAHIDFCETTWTSTDIEQAAKRAHRIGQTRPVLARLFSLRGSADEKVNSALVKKGRDIVRLDLALRQT